MTDNLDVVETELFGRRYIKEIFRWLNLVLYVIITFTNGAITSIFSPLASNFTKVIYRIIWKIYEVPVSYFNVNAILTVILYFPANFAVANFAFSHLGLHQALSIGLVLNCLCSFFRTLINYDFLLSMLGGFFFGIAQPLIMNSNAELANNWFDSGEVI